MFKIAELDVTHTSMIPYTVFCDLFDFVWKAFYVERRTKNEL